MLDRPGPAFELPGELIAEAPLEASGHRRDAARLLVATRSDERLVDATMADIGRFLDPGDVLVVNNSATLAAAVPTTGNRLLHLSTELPSGAWVVELRRRSGAGSLPGGGAARVGEILPLPAGGRATLLSPFPDDGRTTARLWVASLALPTPLTTYLASVGRPIRYGRLDRAWPLAAYQTVFATVPGSAEMASAARPFTAELVTSLVASGVVFAPLTLHTGVSSQEAGEPPYPERYEVPPTTAELVNGARAGGRRVVAVGTTSVRALETVADGAGRVHAGAGWTELVVTPDRGVRAVDGILTGWHEPDATHLALLEAVAGRPLVARSYAHALAAGYRWHHFGDVHLVLP